MSERGRRIGFAGRLIRYWRDRRGAISPMMVMALVPLIGAMAMGTEATNWWLLQRQAQNAADSAAIAAANNGSVNGASGTPCAATGDWCNEAKSVASQYGFADGKLNTTVAPTVGGPADGANNKCPATLANADKCFQVTVSRTVPVSLLSVVGFKGSQGNGNQTISASATAYATGGGNNTTTFCILALGSLASKDLTINGGPNSNLPNCAIGSNGGTTCNGGSITGVAISYAAPDDMSKNDCAPNAADNVPLRAPITDPYSGLASNIPANTCSSANFSTEGKNVATLAAANQLSGTIAAGTTKIVCGDAGLVGNLTLKAGAMLVVVDGQIDLSSFTLDGTAGATIIFTGVANPQELNSKGKVVSFTPNAPSIIGGNGSVFDMTAQSTGGLQGFAIYTDPSATDVPASSFTIAGQSGPSYLIDGLWYSPNANITLDGCIGGGACNGGAASQCLGFLVNTLIIDGNADLINEPDCHPITLSSSNEGFLAGVVVLVK